MRHSRLVFGIVGVGLAIIAIAALITVTAMRAATPQSVALAAGSADAAPVAPILSEEVDPGTVIATLKRPNADLTLLADSGAEVANVHVARRTAGEPLDTDLNTKLRSTESKFVGSGLEGSANVNGKPFSWANVNLSNISYG
jgi:hypothetical protein